MRKTLKDLKPGDPLFYVQSNGVLSMKVTTLSTSQIKLGGDKYKIEIHEGDWMRFICEGMGKYSSYDTKFYTEKIDALTVYSNTLTNRIRKKHEGIRLILSDIEAYQTEQIDIEKQIKNELV